MEKLKKFLTKENILLLGIFIFFLCICFFTPLVGDDWKNYIISSKGLKEILDGTISMYLTWEGRIGSRFFIYLLTSHKIIYDILVALFTTLTIYFVGHFFRLKNRYVVYILSFLSIVLCSRNIFLETYLYVAGGITYLFPTMFLIGYLYYYFQVLSKRGTHWYENILLCLIAIILPTFIEHIGITFAITHFVLFVYRTYQNKKIDYLFLSLFLLSVISCLIVIMSPGTALRNHVDGNQLSMIETVFHNYRNFIYYTFTTNSFLLILMNVVYMLFIHKVFRSKIAKLVSILLAVIPSTVIAILEILHDFGMITLYLQDNKLVIFYFMVYAVGLVFLFITAVRDKRYYLLLLTAILPNIAMLASPIWGGRTTFTSVLLLSILCILLIEQYLPYKKQKLGNIFLTITTIIVCSIYMIGYYHINQFYTMQKKTINENKSSGSICIYEVPKHLISGLVPMDQYHIETYKEYHHISTSVKLDYCHSDWKYGIFYQK